MLGTQELIFLLALVALVVLTSVIGIAVVLSRRGRDPRDLRIQDLEEEIRRLKKSK